MPGGGQADLEVLHAPSDVTSHWLSRALGFEVDIVRYEPMEDSGIISPVARLRLTSEDGPTSVILKCSPPDDEFRARLAWALKAEALFYRDIGEECGLPVPHSWYSKFCEDDNRCTIVMEDLYPLTPGDNWEGLSPEQTLRGVELLAHMHTRHWGRVKHWPWLAERTAAFTSSVAAAESAAPIAIERYGNHIPDSVRAVLPNMRDHILATETVSRAGSHTTLIHGDFHAANLAFGETPADVKVFDWQLAMASSPGLDLVKLIANGLTIEQRRSFGDDLIELYRELLAKRDVGVDRSMLDALIHDAVIARLGNVLRIASWAEEGSFTDRWTILCFERMGAALDDGW